MTRHGAFSHSLHILLVDSDPTCLVSVTEMLKLCSYKVTTAKLAFDALSMLQERREQFDLVIANFHMPDMNGFTLLRLMVLHMDMPVILMSADEQVTVIRRALENGASFFLKKPITIEMLKNLWQYVFRKSKNKIGGREEACRVADQAEREKASQGIGREPLITEGNGKKKGSKGKRPIEYEEDESNDGRSRSNCKQKKPRRETPKEEEEFDRRSRLHWTNELHDIFINVINQIGYINAVPQKIQEMMNVPGLTRQQIASHLQKYRLNRSHLYNLSISNPPNSSTSSPSRNPFHMGQSSGNYSGLGMGSLSYDIKRGAHTTQMIYSQRAHTTQMIYPQPQAGPRYFGSSPVEEDFGARSHQNHNTLTNIGHAGSYGGSSELPQLGHTNNYVGLRMTSNGELDGFTRIRMTGGLTNDVSLSGKMSNEIGIEKLEIGSEESSNQIPQLITSPNFSYATPGLTSPIGSPILDQYPRACTNLIQEPNNLRVVGSPNTGDLGSIYELLENSMFENNFHLQQFDEFDFEEIFPKQPPDGAAAVEADIDIQAYKVDEDPSIL